MGARVTAVRDDPRRPRVPETAHQLDLLGRIGVPAVTGEQLPPRTDLVVDALVGYGLRGPLRTSTADLVRAATTLVTAAGSGVPVLALDVPSGLDADRGTPGPDCVVATATLTLALPKVRSLQPAARRYVGRLHVADISVPPSVYTALGLAVADLFAGEDVVEVG